MQVVFLTACALLLVVSARDVSLAQAGAFGISLFVSGFTLLTAVRVRPQLGLMSPLGLAGLAHLTSFTLPAALIDYERVPAPPGVVASIPHASWAAALFLLAATGYVASQGQPSVESATVLERVERGVPTAKAVVVWVFAVSVAVVSFRLLVAGSGVGSYATSLGNRRVAFSGRVWVTWGLLFPGAFAQALWFLVQSSREKRFSVSFLKWASAATGVLFALLNGNRTSVIGLVISLLVINRMGSSRAQVSKQIVFVVLGILLSSTLLGLTRSGSVENASLSVSNPLDGFYELEEQGAVATFGQLPASSWLFGERKVGYSLGKTYVAGFTQGIPRALAPWKPPGVGQVVTEAYWPDLWRRGTGIQVGAAGEAFVNFGWAGIPIVGLLFGISIHRISGVIQTGRYGAVELLAMVFVSRSALLIRGGFASVVGLFLMEVVPMLLFWFIMRRSANAPR